MINKTFSLPSLCATRYQMSHGPVPWLVVGDLNYRRTQQNIEKGRVCINLHLHRGSFFPTGLVCNRTFDNYACWPDGLPNTTVSVACPWYLPWYHKGKRQACAE